VIAAIFNVGLDADDFDKQRERVRVANFDGDQRHFPLNPAHALIRPFLFLDESAVPDGEW
jgi:hypothetical protein